MGAGGARWCIWVTPHQTPPLHLPGPRGPARHRWDPSSSDTWPLLFSQPDTLRSCPCKVPFETLPPRSSLTRPPLSFLCRRAAGSVLSAVRPDQSKALVIVAGGLLNRHLGSARALCLIYAGFTPNVGLELTTLS